MAIISFENLVDDAESIEIPDGYSNLNWKNFWVADDEAYEKTDFDTAIHSGEASAFNYYEKPAIFKSPDREDDFELNSGYFAAFNNDLKVKVFGFDDGERIATKVFSLDPDQEFVTSGREFDDI